MGEPIARSLLDRGVRVLGVRDSEWLVADMRERDLGRRFEGILAWNSFFHLGMDDQRAMFRRFASHARPGGPLMFTSGAVEGEAIGSYCDEPLYHGSLGPREYEQLLAENGFEVEAHVVDDPECGDHTVWLATCERAAPGLRRR